MKKIILLVVLFFGIAGASAQSFEEYKKQANKEFSDYKEDQNRAFKEYRDKVNSEYADFMRKAWTSLEVTEAVEIPELPEPPEPVVRDPEEKITADPIIFDNVVMPPAPRPELPKPVIPFELLDDSDEQDDVILEDDSVIEDQTTPDIVPPKPVVDPDLLPDPIVDDPKPEPVPVPDPIVDDPKPEPVPVPDPIVDDPKPEPVPVPDPIVDDPKPEPVPVPDPIVDDPKPEPVPVPDPIVDDPKPEPVPVPDPIVDDPKPEPVPVPDPIVDDPKPEPVPVPDPIVDDPKPEPVPVPIPDPKPIEKGFNFTLYGTECSVSLKDTHRYTLKSVKENDVADAWTMLSNDKYNSVIADALSLRDNLGLSDWGYVRLLEEMTTNFFGKNAVNEARLLQLFILVQSGYNVRIARTDSHLALLLPFDYTIYQFSYFTLDGQEYYILDRSGKSANYYIFDRKFPNEQILSVNIPQTPELEKNLSPAKTFTVNNISVTASVNKNLMDFYSDFPRNSSWVEYSKAPISNELKAALYPKLKAVIAGMNEVDATQQLLSFVQYAFDYKTDQDQFGYERSLFCDETFYYPFSDCEDRSILFAHLVKELVGLDVVLLFYNKDANNQHLATAVKFNSDTNGDYFTLSNEHYIVCDPTYIGASIGMTMPQFKGLAATVYYF